MKGLPRAVRTEGRETCLVSDESAGRVESAAWSVGKPASEQKEGLKCSELRDSIFGGYSWNQRCCERLCVLVWDYSGVGEFRARVGLTTTGADKTSFRW